MKWWRYGMLSLCFFIVSFIQAQVSTPQLTPSACGTNTKYRSCYDVVHYLLNVRFDIVKKTLRGSNEISFTALKSTDTLQLDLHENMALDSVIWTGKKLKTYRVGNTFFIIWTTSLTAQKKQKIKIYYHGQPHEAIDAPWQGGVVWKMDKYSNPWIGVACEGLGASSWWPCKDFLNDKPDSVTCVYEVPKALTCIGNGVFAGKKRANKYYDSYTWKTNYPIANYNVTFNIGKYAHFQSTAGKLDGSLSRDYYVMAYNLEKAQKHFLQVDTILSAFEHFFGKYPFAKDGYALVETPYLGMEHQGAIAYGNNFKTNFLNDFIILHETAHEWWGNNVAADDLAEMWIQESFATYSEWLFYEKVYGTAVAKQYAASQRRLIKNEKPMLGPRGICYPALDNLDIYYKGAWMLHTIRNWVDNDSLWFSSLKGMQDTFALKQVNTSIIVPFLNKKLNINLDQSMYYYLLETALPVLEYKVTNLELNVYQLTYRWRVANGKEFDMPMPIYLNGTKRLLMPNTSLQHLIITQEEATHFSFPEQDYLIKVSEID